MVAGGLAALALRDATRTIPVVFVGVGDPLGTGLVASLARPGGNITGLANMSNELIAKRLQLLMEVARGAVRVAYLTYETGVTWVDEEVGRTAAALGLQWLQVKVIRQQDLAAAIAARTDAEAWYVGDPVLVFDRAQVVSLLAMHRKPVVYPNSNFVRAGGLLSYGANSLGAVSPRRVVRGQDPARNQASRYSHRAADPVRAGDQSRDREGDRADPAARRYSCAPTR